MELIKRISKTIFKCTLSVNVDYHAGGFFVKKKVSYLIFTNEENVILYDREEGLHPRDNNFEFLLNKISNDGKGYLYKVSQPNANVNILKLSNLNTEIFCMPSIFSENIIGENLSEIVTDNKGSHIQLVYSLVHKMLD